MATVTGSHSHTHLRERFEFVKYPVYHFNSDTADVLFWKAVNTIIFFYIM